MKARVFEQDTVWYDLIVGRHTLRQMGFKVDFEEDIMTWDDGVIAMRPFSLYSGMNEVTQLEMLLYNHLEETLEEDAFASVDMKILLSKYNSHDIKEYVHECKHLNEDQQEDLYAVLSDFNKLFDGKLKEYQGELVHLELKPDVVPQCAWPYLVA